MLYLYLPDSARWLGFRCACCAGLCPIVVCPGFDHASAAFVRWVYSDLYLPDAIPVPARFCPMLPDGIRVLH